MYVAEVRLMLAMGIKALYKVDVVAGRSTILYPSAARLASSCWAHLCSSVRETLAHDGSFVLPLAVNLDIYVVL